MKNQAKQLKTKQIELKRLVGKNPITGLQQLSKILHSDDGKLESDLIHFQSQLKRLNKSQHRNLISYSEYCLEEDKLRNRIFGFIDDLEMENFRKLEEFQEEIHTKILVICYDEDAKTEIEPFFNRFYFKNVDYAIDTLDEEKLQWSEIVLFNNLNIPDNEFRYNQNLLKTYLDKLPKQKYLLYLGNGKRNELIDSYENKAYAANSRFALYARLHELMDFMKYYKEEETIDSITP